MGDQHLRDLERRWRETGAVEDEAAYLRERVRQGDLTHDKLFLAAYLGVPAAMAALDEKDRPWMGDMRTIRELRQRLFELCPEASPVPLTGPEIRAVSEADDAVPSKVLLLLTVVGVGNYGGGVTIERPSPADGHADLHLLGRSGERSLAHDGRGRVGFLSPTGLERRHDDPLKWLERHLRSHDPAHVPWHVANVTRRGRSDPEDWSARTRAWCEQIRTDSDYSLRTHLRCPKCRFPFIYRTSNYSLSASADVRNWGTCADPDCRHDWTELS